MKPTIYTDVFIIGGGGAGLCGALAAVEAGASVTLAVKAGGNCTAMAAGGFAVVLEGEGQDSVDLFLSDALRSGAGLADTRLLTRLARDAPAAIARISDWGVEFYRRDDGALRPFRSGGHSVPRSLRCNKGRGGDAYRIMLHRARDQGVQIVKDALITDLLKDGNRVIGAAGMDSEGQPIIVSAKTVILATGGMAALYEHTTNTKGLTGEGYVLAREAGCRLRDLEFVQFMPTTFAWPPHLKGRLVNDTLRGEGAYLLNSNMERFMEQYDPDFMEVATRDVLSIAIASELAAGRGTPHGGVWVDARHIPEKAMLDSFGFARQLIAAGIHPAKDLIEVVPAAHFSCGGVVIDEECRTGVEGLYAVGEVTGGMHGANRLGATALTENVVFGQIAGRNAAAEAMRGGTRRERLPRGAFAERLARQGAPASPGLGERLAQGESQVKHILWQYGGILRSADGIREGKRLLADLRERVGACPTGDFSQTLQSTRLEQLIALAGLVLKAALLRTESRGCHYRTDFPHQNPAQAVSIVLEKDK